MSTALVWSDFDLSRNGSVAKCERGIEKQVITVNWKIFSVFYRLKNSNSRCLSKCFFTALKVARPGVCRFPGIKTSIVYKSHAGFILKYCHVKQKNSLIFSLKFTQQLAAPWGDVKVYWVCSSSDWHNHSQLYPRCFERGRQFPGLSCRDSPSRHEVWVR